MGGDACHVCLLKVVKAFVTTYKAIDVPTLPTWLMNVFKLNDYSGLGCFGLFVCHVSKGETLRQADTLRKVWGVAIVNLDTPRGGGLNPTWGLSSVLGVRSHSFRSSR